MYERKQTKEKGMNEKIIATSETTAQSRTEIEVKRIDLSGENPTVEAKPEVTEDVKQEVAI